MEMILTNTKKTSASLARRTNNVLAVGRIKNKREMGMVIDMPTVHTVDVVDTVESNEYILPSWLDAHNKRVYSRAARI